MTSFLKLTAVSGARNEDPLCYLLEIDSVHVLLDCGWFESFDTHSSHHLKHLRRVAKQVDFVLLSHGDVAHLGAYPYAFGHLGLNCPAYATLPVHHMGKLTVLDALKSKLDSEPFDLFTKDDINAAFDRITQLRYSQPTALTGKCKGITITAYSAGHTIGGTIWKIKKDTDEIVYAVDYNHKKDRHLNGTALHGGGAVLEALARPSLLITDSYNANSTQPSRKNRDAALFDTLISTLDAEGSCLLPVDTATRILELAHMLDQHWQFHRLNQYPLVLLTHQSRRVVQFAKSMLEWMGDAVAKHFASTRESPYEFKHVRLCHSMEELNKLPRGPKVVMASTISMETGFSRALFARWAEDPSNAIVLTGRGPRQSLARWLLNEWEAMVTTQNSTTETEPAPKGGITVPPAASLDCILPLVVKSQIPLQGAELAEYQRAEAARKEQEAVQALAIEQLVDESDSDESDDSDIPDVESRPPAGNSRMFSALPGGSAAALLRSGAGASTSSSSWPWPSGHDLYVKDATRSGGFFKQTQSYRLFPYPERKRKFDDYGEAIVPEHYIRAGEIEAAEAEKADEAKAAEASTSGMDLDQGAKDEPDEDVPGVPTKYVSETKDIHIRCLVRYIDLEGLSDGKSIKTILSQVAPRKLIIVHGSQDATDKLSEYAKSSKQITDDVHAPAVGETVNVSSASNVYQVKLTDALVSSLKFKKMDEYELAHISAHVDVPADSIVPVLDLPQQQKAEEAWHRPIFVGEVRLTDLKRALQAEGISAEFGGEGVLYCNEAVALSKAANGKLNMEGALSDDYYKVRSILYSMHAIL